MKDEVATGLRRAICEDYREMQELKARVQQLEAEMAMVAAGVERLKAAVAWLKVRFSALLEIEDEGGR